MTNSSDALEMLPEEIPATHSSMRPADAAKGSRAPAILGGLALVGALAGGGYYLAHRGFESTDDAQFDAEIVSVPARTPSVVTRLLFVENQRVKAGDLLAELDPEPARAKLALAEANLQAAKTAVEAAKADERVTQTVVHSNKSAAAAMLAGAQSSVTSSRDQIAEGEAAVASAAATLAKTQLELDRAKALVGSEALPQADFDKDQAARDVAVASLDQAKARLASLRASTSVAASRVQEASARAAQAGDVESLLSQAEVRVRTAEAQVAVATAARDQAALELSYTKVTAPQDGIVSKKSVGIGQMLAVGQGVAQLVPTRELWVTGNFKETQLTHMRAGQPAQIEVDAFPGVKISGEVESLSGATGARFSLLPPDNATGNFTKVVQRVPVRVRLKELPADLPVRPGLSVDLTVDTRR